MLQSPLSIRHRLHLNLLDEQTRDESDHSERHQDDPNYSNRFGEGVLDGGAELDGKVGDVGDLRVDSGDSSWDAGDVFRRESGGSTMENVRKMLSPKKCPFLQLVGEHNTPNSNSDDRSEVTDEDEEG